MIFFQVGDKVKHNFSGEIGFIAEVDTTKTYYKYYVQWDSEPERSDWYKASVLLRIPKEPGAMTLSDIGM